MATVVRETERKYDLDAGGSAALDAVQAMTGTAGVAASSRPGEQLLDAVCAEALIADLTATISCHHAGADALARACRRAVISGTGCSW